MKKFLSPIWPQDVEPPDNPFASWQIPHITDRRFEKFKCSFAFSHPFITDTYSTPAPNFLSDGFLRVVLSKAIIMIIENVNDLRQMAETNQESSGSLPRVKVSKLSTNVEALYQLLLAKWVMDQRHRLGRNLYFDSENRKAFEEIRKLSKSAETWFNEVARELADLGFPAFRYWHDSYTRPPFVYPDLGELVRRAPGPVDVFTLSGRGSESESEDFDEFHDIEESETDGLSTFLDLDTGSVREAIQDLEPFLSASEEKDIATTLPLAGEDRGPHLTTRENRTTVPSSAPAPPMHAHSECDPSPSPLPSSTVSAPPPSQPQHAPAPPSTPPTKDCLLSVPCSSQKNVPSSKQGTKGEKQQKKRPNWVLRVLVWCCCCCGGVKAGEEPDEERVPSEPEERTSPPSLPPSDHDSQSPLPSPPVSPPVSPLLPTDEGRDSNRRRPAEEQPQKLQVEDVFASPFVLLNSDDPSQKDESTKSDRRRPAEEQPQKLQVEDVFASPFVLLNSDDPSQKDESTKSDRRRPAEERPQKLQAEDVFPLDRSPLPSLAPPEHDSQPPLPSPPVGPSVSPPSQTAEGRESNQTPSLPRQPDRETATQTASDSLHTCVPCRRASDRHLDPLAEWGQVTVLLPVAGARGGGGERGDKLEWNGRSRAAHTFSRTNSQNMHSQQGKGPVKAPPQKKAHVRQSLPPPNNTRKQQVESATATKNNTAELPKATVATDFLMPPTPAVVEQQETQETAAFGHAENAAYMTLQISKRVTESTSYIAPLPPPFIVKHQH
uniref:Uncharacterized protein n=1 Tax=Chromera velia CCMP2878 TaxID=1169474 RepID=A0A0G4HTM0_9ALVE|eukprot:Cvel_8445.t1-p1 / transcript=Cvel_8445.t1 / gene=Cvel_8445 / organism=Chromera_velia_CCMP2878 / gene_product=hypothetical protein / transcript_product=hypothetical protein / location=Cvel_scaffold466:46405-54648(-) / protein_length=775 / sequence_SO=supercontig / SO=protein_coding / is_pseudo=false